MNYSIYDNSQTNDIIQLFTQTFTDSEGREEGTLIGKLAEELLTTTPKQDIYVFVATENEKVTGSIMFTRLTFESSKIAFLLAPVAVSTPYQGKGVGQELIKIGLETLKQKGIDLLFTYGDPTFYTKIGFERITEEQFKAPMPLSYPHGWLAQSLTLEGLGPIAGDSACVPAFNDPALW